MCENKEKLRKSVIYDFSTKVSELNRTLILSGIGIIWIFAKKDDNGIVSLDEYLFWTLFLFVVSISFDLLQYLVSIILNAIFITPSKKMENMPDWYSIVPWVLWSMKVLLMIIAYVLIIIYLFDNIKL